MFLFLSGCAGLDLQQSGPLSNADLQIRVSSTDTPGTYVVSGDTSLPDKTKLTVTAVRYLTSASPSTLLNSDVTYSVLASREVEVNQSRWEANLNLWKVDPQGRYQESWQIDQSDLNLVFTPQSDVVFLATLSRISQLPQASQAAAARNSAFEGKLVRFTTDGERFIQAEQTLAVALPTGSTTPPLPEPDQNAGARSRLLANQNTAPPVSDTPRIQRTNAPISPRELFQ